MIRHLRALAVAATLLLTLAPAWAQMSDPDIRSAYAAAKAELAPLISDISPDERAAIIERRKWSLEAQWLCNFLTDHPSPTAEVLLAALGGLDDDLKKAALTV
jgi:hypothetical protein